MTDKDVLREMLTRAGIEFREEGRISYPNVPTKRVVGRHYPPDPPPTPHGSAFIIDLGSDRDYSDLPEYSTEIYFDLQGNLVEILGG